MHIYCQIQKTEFFYGFDPAQPDSDKSITVFRNIEGTIYVDLDEPRESLKTERIVTVFDIEDAQIVE